MASENLHPLIARLRAGDIGPESTRGALRVLAELDLDLLVQVTLDSLVTTYLDDPGLAFNPDAQFAGNDRTQVEPDASGSRNAPV